MLNTVFLIVLITLLLGFVFKCVIGIFDCKFIKHNLILPRNIRSLHAKYVTRNIFLIFGTLFIVGARGHTR